jgi:hypothetical protein
VVDARVPGLVRVEGAETAARALVGALVGAAGGAVAAVLKLAQLGIKPADDAAWRGSRRPVRAIGFFPW